MAPGPDDWGVGLSTRAPVLGLRVVKFLPTALGLQEKSSSEQGKAA